MTSFALPFLTLDDSAISCTPWALQGEQGTSEVLPRILSHWDYARDLSLARSVSVDALEAERKLAIDQRDLELNLVVRTGTGAGILPRLFVDAQVHKITPGKPPLEIKLEVAGNALSKRLFLECTVVLANQTSGSPLSPTIRGSKLWRNVLDVSLEGEDPRFPVEAISFSKRFAGRPEEHALWYLWWSPFSLQLEFSGGVLLYLNSDNEDFIQRVVDRDVLTIRALVSDVMAQMISSAVAQDGCEELLGGYEANTIGHQIDEWLKRAFPGQTAGAVREMLVHRPTIFHATIQSAADLEGVL